MAQLTTKAINTQALETCCFVQAGTAIKARFFCTIVRVDKAVPTFKAISALTSIASVGVYTFSAISARCCHCTFVDVLDAKTTFKAQGTSANIVPEIGGRGTRRSVGAIVVDTRVHLGLACLPCERRLANAHEIVGQINARSMVFARPRFAVVDVLVAIPATVPWRAFASIRIEVPFALSTMLARVAFAHVDFVLAPSSFITVSAVANKFTEAVLTRTTVEARIRSTFIDIRLAPGAKISSRTLAFKAIDYINAFGPMFTRIAHAFVDLVLTKST